MLNTLVIDMMLKAEGVKRDSFNEPNTLTSFLKENYVMIA